MTDSSSLPFSHERLGTPEGDALHLRTEIIPDSIAYLAEAAHRLDPQIDAAAAPETPVPQPGPPDTAAKAQTVVNDLGQARAMREAREQVEEAHRHAA